MKYFLDTEFIEGFHKPLFGKRRHFIDLISIGIYCEDGRSYYAISKEFNPKDASDWVKENVINKLEQQATSFYDSPRLRQNCLLYKSIKEIRLDILQFFKCSYTEGFWFNTNGDEVFGYYSDYDWVVFCSLFGRMIDLPTGFPMYCKDLKQMLDEKADLTDWHHRNRGGIGHGYIEPGNTSLSLKEKLKVMKNYKGYPKQKNEHNALADAKWNYELYKFLQNA